MLCNECKKNEAIYFYSENINGKKYSVALCEDCKKKHSEHKIFDDKHVFDSMLFPYSLFHNNLSYKTEKRCNSCHASLYELTNGNKSFCPECYQKFKEELSDFLFNIQGADRHIGKRPNTVIEKNETNAKNTTAAPKTENPLLKLKKELSDAISEERYEDAARIRDAIKDFEQNGGTNNE